MPSRRSIRSVVAALVATIFVGCAHTAEEVAESAAPAAVESGLEAAASPEAQSQLAALLADPEVNRAAYQLSNRIVDGAFDSFTSEEHSARMNALVDTYVRTATVSFAAAMREHLEPEIARMVGASVDAAFARASAPENREFLGGTAREISRQTVLGARAGLAEARPGGAAGVFATALTTGWAFALFFGLLLIALAIGLIVVYRRGRRDRAEAHRREEAVISLTRAIKSMEERPWSPELRRELREQLRDREGTEYLREVLRQDPSLRLDEPRGPSRPS